MQIDKTKLLDVNGNPLTQSLFLELCYNDYAVYTLKDSDYEYNGRVLPSIKRLYLEEEDVTEYDFASKYLLGWQHWKRLCENKRIREHIDEWREELEIKIRSRAVRDIINLCASESGSFQAAKFLADRGWDKRGAGRPSKAEQEKRAAIGRIVEEEFNHDVARMENYRK